MARLSESERSQILQLLLSCSLLIYFLFWYSWIGTLCGQPSILVRQREVIVNFGLKMDARKAANWRRVMLWHTIDLGEVSRIGIVIWDTRAVWCSCHWQDNTKYSRLVDARQPSTGSYRSTSGPTSVLPVSLNQSSFFVFFDSSIMRKIGPGRNQPTGTCWRG